MSANPLETPRPRRALSVRTNLLAALAPLPVVIVAALLVYRALDVSLAITRQIADSYRRETAASEVMKLAIDAETGERGYLIAGDEALLRPYRDAVGVFGASLARLRQEAEARPEQRTQIDHVERLFERWRAEAAEPLIALRRDAPPEALTAATRASLAAMAILDAPGAPQTEPWRVLHDEVGRLLEAAPARASALAPLVAELEPGAAAVRLRPAVARARAELLRIAHGLQAEDDRITASVAEHSAHGLLDDIRHEIAELQADEQQLRASLADKAALANLLARLAAFAAPALALLLGVGAALWLSRGLARSATRIASAAERLAHGDLSCRAQADGHSETAVIAHAFNMMADRLQARDRESELLRELADLLQSCGSLEEAYEVLERTLGDLFPRHAGAVFLINRAAPSAVVSARFGGLELTPEEAVFSLDACWALRRGKEHARCEAAGMRCRHVRGDEASCTLCLPMNAYGEALGLLHLRGRPGAGFADFLTPDERRLADTVGEQIALAVANLRLRERLRDQALRDPLTGLFNRRYLEATVPRELERARRRKLPVAVLVIDIDHFKQVNDEHGHDAGDAVLVELGTMLRTQLRGEDIACRLGGEEFVVVLAGAELADAERRAEELRCAAERMRIAPPNGRSMGPVTVSIGVSGYPAHAQEWEPLLKAADLAMYKAKAAGRNRVVVAGDGHTIAA